jgi:single-stranded-DNA-specific exonuclease
VVLTPSLKHGGQLRGIDYHPFHCRAALQYVADRAPALLPAFGGHQGAAGLSIPADGLAEFRVLFDQACGAQLADEPLGPVIITDGMLDGYSLDQALIHALDELEPFGRGFEAPCFELVAEIMDLRVIGAERNHLKLRLGLDDQDGPIGAVWFHVRERASEPLPVVTGQRIHCAGIPSMNTYRGVSRPQFVISGVRTDPPNQ